MLDVTLEFLTTELQAYLVRRTGAAGGELGGVTPRRLVDDAGKYTLGDGQIGATLVHVEEERALKTSLPETTMVGGLAVRRPPPLNLSLHVLFAINFQHYPTALRYLSLLLTFFQAHASFSPAEFPRLDSRIDKLTVELLPLTYEQLNQLWAFVGAKQIPSAAYRVRMVSLQDAESIAGGPPITSIHTEVLRR